MCSICNQPDNYPLRAFQIICTRLFNFLRCLAEQPFADDFRAVAGGSIGPAMIKRYQFAEVASAGIGESSAGSSTLTLSESTIWNISHSPPCDAG